ncbi:MAG: hypothetical protein WB709_12435 [Solirubrobacteraceae bacterium]
MNTVRIARHWINADSESVGTDRRGLLVVPLLCVVLFAGCFALGRAASSRSGARAQAVPSLPVAFAGAAVPFHLSGAPPIQVRTVVSTRSPEHVTRSHQTPVQSTLVTAGVPAAGTPRVPAPVREVVARAPSPTPTPLPAPASARGTGEGQSNEGQSKPHASSGTSFDSSG